MGTGRPLRHKRKDGPFDAGRMTDFYGKLKGPLMLHGVRKLGKEQYEARYTFETHAGRFCDGISIVTTTVREGRNLIARIKAPNGCCSTPADAHNGRGSSPPAHAMARLRSVVSLGLPSLPFPLRVASRKGPANASPKTCPDPPRA